MSGPLHPETLLAIQRRAIDACVEEAVEVAERMLDENGLAYGDVELKSPGEFVGFYADLEERGVLVHLRTLAPRFSERLRRRFEREAENLREAVR